MLQDLKFMVLLLITIPALQCVQEPWVMGTVSGGRCISWGTFGGCRSYSNDYTLRIQFIVYEDMGLGWTMTAVFCRGASNWEVTQQVSFLSVMLCPRCEPCCIGPLLC